MKKRTSLPLLLTAIFALFAMALVFVATTHGPGVGGDATIYLTSAENLIAGNGLGWTEADGSFRLLPYTPPFYPLTLSLIGFLGDMVAGARLLNVVLFAATVALCGLGFTRFTGQGWLGALLGGLLAFSPVLLGVEVWAMSEPLFLLLGFGGLFALLAYLETRRRGYWIASAVLCGLAFLTRYMGLAFPATAGLALLLLGRGEDRRVRLSLVWRNLRDAVLFGILCLLPILAWFVVDFSITGTLGSRSGQPAAAYWQRFLEIGPALQQIVLFWLVPDSVSARLPGVLQTAAWIVPLVLLVGLAVLLVRRSRESGRKDGAGQQGVSSSAVRLAVVFGLFGPVYLIVLAVAQVYTYPPITLASRMLSPFHLSILVWMVALFFLGLRILAPRSRLAWTVVSLGLLAFLGSYALRSALIARDYHSSGIGYNAVSWRGSQTIAALKDLPADVPLISNETTAIMYLAGRPAYALQEIYQDHPQETFTVYGEGNDVAQRVFREQNGALVLFKANLEEDFAMYGDQAGERVRALTEGLYPYFDGEDGAIFFIQPPEQ